MDQRQIEKLMAAMNRFSMKRVVWKYEGGEVELELQREGVEYHPVVAPHPVEVHHHPQRMEHTPLLPHKENFADRGAPGLYVTSPMVGTFYASPSPQAPAYVKVGDMVDEDTLFCIIEAMKVMNEVKAGVKGRIAEILVKNGDPVEFGSNIARIEP